MELKVWCDGIQRVVCGASVSTTCQDIVFALAHATGQTGRFILIEKWRNNERVLAPTDRPLTSLAKWNRDAHSDVTFVMKRSGDVSLQNKENNKSHFTLPSNKSDSELVHKRKVLITSLMNSNQDKSNAEKCSNTPMGKYAESSINHSATLPLKNKAEPFVRSISFHKAGNHSEPSSQLVEGHKGNYSQIYSTTNELYQTNLNSERPMKPSPTLNEPLYGSLSKNRPPQPPPYKEAITKSTLFNAPGSSANSIYGYTGSPNIKSNFTSSQLGINGKQPSLEDQLTTKKLNSHIANNYSPKRSKDFTSIHQNTMNLIDMQQQTMKSQEKDVIKIEQELDLVQRKLSENEMIVKQYKEEMELLKQLWMEQETLIEKLESENMEEELNRLIIETTKYEEDVNEVRQKLSLCENEVLKCREQICDLMNKVEGSANLKDSNIDPGDFSLMEQLHKAIQEKTKEIDNQNCDLNSLNASIERLDNNIGEKNDIIDKLTIEIKEANVEGLSLQSSGLYVEDGEKANCDPATPARLGTNRKIPVLPRDLGNTVPTKKNPNGIWV